MKERVRKLREKGSSLGYSVSFLDGKSSCEINFGEKGYVHMGAVLEDQGEWDDLSQYLASDQYLRLSAWQKMTYPLLAQMSNRNIERIREGG